MQAMELELEEFKPIHQSKETSQVLWRVTIFLTQFYDTVPDQDSGHDVAYQITSLALCNTSEVLTE